jgi:alginate O-acetyltransferase complex protein AlgJ
VRAILEFHRQLRARGIDLFVLPVPAKPAIHPEYFSAYRTRPARPLENPSFAAWVDQLQAAGANVIDAGAVLLAAARAENRPQYLATDTHWRPEAMDRVAQAAARAIADLPGWSGPEVAYRRDGDTLSQDGDLVPMLKLPARFAPPSETVEIQTVLTPRRELWRPAVDAPVLVLGDSFCNIYSLSAMGWGSGAGFAEQLSFHLGRPVDRLVRNDDGAWATRQMLSRELALGRDRLAGKRAVIWVFAERELALGDWREIPMTAGHPPARRFLEMAPGRELLVTGVVAAVSAVPVPGSVPYRDHIAAVHVVDLPAEQGPEAAKSEAVVYLWSMQNNVLQPGARLQPGQSVSLRLSAWADVASERDAINRSELEDGELQWQEPLWGELTND